MDWTPTHRSTYLRYAGLHLPRHTSYPIVPVWRNDYDATAAHAALDRSSAPLSLYFHVPYCSALCYFCACNKVIRPKHRHPEWEEDSRRLVETLLRETQRKAELLTNPRPVRQIHLGGGSPTYLRPDDLTRLLAGARELLPIASDAEISVEVDPRVTTREHILALRYQGAGRLSLGIQDFDPKVQAAVNRIQPYESIRDFTALCREIGFSSINFDLIYAMPFQTRDSMRDSVQRTVRLRPDRIAFYRMAILPEMFRWQKVFRKEDFPSPETTLDMLLDAREAFIAAGYEFLGLDHFALPEEDLARALRNGTIRRTFQGMTTGRPLDVVGIGPSAISILADAYFQNEKGVPAWESAVRAGETPVVLGMDLSAEDRLRNDVLQDLYGLSRIDGAGVARRHGIVFAEHFADELRRLETLAADGIVEVSGEGIRLTPLLGRLLVRVAAAIFDAYLPPDAYREGLPATASSSVG